MSTRSAVILTTRFPFGASEFMEHEIEQLCGAFDHVRVVPSQTDGRRAPVPANAQVDTGVAELRLAGEGRSQFLRRQLHRGANTLREAIHSNLLRELLADRRPPSRSWMQAVVMATSHYADVRTWAASVQPPDLAYTFWLGPSTRALREAWPSSVVVSRAHGGDIDGTRLGFQRLPFLCENVLSADHVFSVSEWGRTELAAACPLAASRVSVATLGSIDVGGITPRSTDGTLRVLSVSSVDANKRVGLIGDAVGLIASAGQPVEWRHLGAGPLLDAVRASVREAPPTLRARLEGPLPLQAVVEVLRTGPWDVFVNVSQHEGAPVSVMEAQSAGVPCVVTAVCGTTEVVDADLDIHVAVDTDAAGVADAIVAAARTPAEFGSIRRDRWLRRFDRQKAAAEFIDAALSLLPPASN